MILNIIAHLLMSSQYKQIHANSCICIQREIFLYVLEYLWIFFISKSIFFYSQIYICMTSKEKRNSPLLNVLLEEGFYLFVFVFIWCYTLSFM